MADTRRLNILIEAKNNASKTLNTLQDKVKSMKPTFQKMAMIGTAATAGIAYGIKNVTELAGDAEGALAKFEAVFAENTDEMNTFIDELRKDMPLATTDIMKLASGLQDLLIPMGLSRDAATDLSKNFLTVSDKIAAFNDVSPAEVLESIRSGLVGSSEPLRKFGVDARVGALEAIALEEGLIKAGQKFADLDPKTRAAATAEALFIQVTNQSADAINNYEENQDSYIRRQLEMAASTKEAKEAIGTAFLPVLDKLLKKILPVIEKIADWVKENPELAKNIGIAALAISGLVAVIGIVGLILPAIITGLGFLGVALSAVGTAFMFLISPIGLVIIAVIALAIIIYKNWDKIKEVTIKVFTAIKEFFVNTWDSISTFFTNTITNIKNTASNIWNGIKDMFSNVWEGIKTIFKTYINFVVGLVSKLLSLVGIDLGELIENIKDGFNKGWDIIKNIFTTMWEFIKEIFTRVFNFYYEIFEKIKNVLIKVFEWFKTTFVESTKPLVEAWKSIWNALIEAFNKIVEKVKEPKTNLVNWLGDKFKAVAKWVRKIWDKAKEVGGNIVGAGSDITGYEANGGPVRSGGTYVVGEKGPEIFTPSTSGKIIPNNKLKGASGGQAINITVNGDISGEDLIDKVSQGIMRNLSFNTNLNI